MHLTNCELLAYNMQACIIQEGLKVEVIVFQNDKSGILISFA